MRFDFTPHLFFAPTPNTGGASGAPSAEDVANAEKLFNILRKTLPISEAEARIRVETARAQGTLNEELEVYQERLESISFQSDYIFQSFRDTTAELKNQNTLLNIGKSAFKKLSDIASDINYYQRGSNDLTDKQLKKLGENLVQQTRDLELIKQRNTASVISDRETKIAQLENLAREQGLSDIQKERLKTLNKEKEVYEASKNALEQTLPILQNELDFSKKISQTRKDLGGMATAAAGTISKYGGELSQFLNIDAAKESVEDYNKKIIEDALKSDAVLKKLHDNERDRIELEAKLESATGAERADFLSQLENLSKKDLNIKKEAIDKAIGINEKFGALKVLVKGLGEGLKKSLTDPLTIITSIVDSLLTGSTGIAAFEKSLGVSYGQAYKLNNEMNAVAAATNDTFITGEKLKKSFIDLSESMGFVADYGSEALVSMTNLTGKLGMSNQEAAQLTTLSRMQSTNTEDVLDNIGKSVTAMNKQGKTTILLKDVMKEVANVSKATAVSLGSNPVKIAEAVVAAKQLGTTLQQMESTADSLLNFESSIENELKAELLTGKELNLERARAAALANDMKTLSEEIGKNEEIIGAFASNNRVAQQATAEALGMSREELANMVYKQEAMTIGAEGVRAKYGEQAYEALKAQSAQEKFANAVEKLKTVLSSIVQIFSPIIDALAFLVDNTFVLYGLMGGIALVYLPKIVTGFKSTIGSVGSLGKSIKEAFSPEGIKDWFDKVKEAVTETKEITDKAKEIATGAGEKVVDAGKESLTDKLKDKTTETIEGKVEDKVGDLQDKIMGGAEETGDKTDKVEGGSDGSKFKDKMTNIAEGIKAFGNGKVILGGLVGLPASAVGLIAMIPGVVGAKLIELINGPKFAESMIGLSTGISLMGTLTVTAGAANLIAASIGLIAMIPGVAGAKLIELINGPKFTESMIGLSTGISAMGILTVTAGAANLIISSLGLISMIPGTLGALAIQTLINGPKITESLIGLATGLSAMATPSAILGALALIPAALGLTAMIVGAAGGALLGVAGPLIQAGLISLSVGLTTFGAAAMNPMVWAGIGLLTAFGVALIPLGYALKLMLPAIEAFGNAIKSAFEGIGAIIIAAATGISTMFNSLQNIDVIKLLAIGPALIGIGLGLASLGAGGVIGAIGAFLGGDPIEKLQDLAASGDGLTQTATALQAIAGALIGISVALASIDISKLEALDEFASNRSTESIVGGITDFITAPIKAVGEAIGGKDKEKINTGIDLTPMIAAINEVKASVDRLYSKDQSINMDGKKVGTTLVQNSYKSA
jgi:hypothetical protein